jgi:hypothetical protein
LLVEAGSEAFVEEICKPFYASRMGGRLGGNSGLR